MKNKYYFLAITALLLNLFYTSIYAQPDSVKTELTEEEEEISDYNYKLKYKYLNYNLIEEKNLFTIDVTSFGLTYIWQGHQNGSRNMLNIGLRYAHKINPGLSIHIQNNLGYDKYEDYIENFGGSVNAGINYFYNKKDDINNKISANNFNGNYFGIEISGLSYNIYQDTKEIDGITFQEKKTINFNPGIAFKWGINTRINKWLFFDL